MDTMDNTRQNQIKSAPLATEAELRRLAEDIVRYCPSLTHLLLALGKKGRPNPLQSLN
jgi:hypothetical protein